MGRSFWRRPTAGSLAAVAVLVVAAWSAAAPHRPALPDEFVYLASARYWSDTGRLDSRYYNAAALVAQGYPHDDMHPPGYVLLLGAIVRVVGHVEAAALALNALACIAGALLVRSLARRLDLDEGEAFLAGCLFLAVPCTALYVFWALPEVLVVVLALAILRAAAAKHVLGAVVLGLLIAAGLLVRESVLFVLPAAIALLPRRRIWLAGGIVALLLATLVVPLSRHRAEGGTNLWRATNANSAISFGAVRAGAAGDLATAVRALSARIRSNARIFTRDTSATEKWILLLYAAIGVLGTGHGWRRPELRAYALGLALGTAGLVVAMAAFFDVPPWTGSRYWLVLVPPFLPLVAACGRRAAGFTLVAGLFLSIAAQAAFTPYKNGRHDRQERLTTYVDRHVPAGIPRIAFDSGYHYGLAHYPVEVISSLPEDRESMARLEETLWFDYLVVRPDDDLRRRIDKKETYERVNGEDFDAPLIIFRRRR